MQNEVYCVIRETRQKWIQEIMHQHEWSFRVLIDAFLPTTVYCYPSIGNTLLHCYVSAVGGTEQPIPNSY